MTAAASRRAAAGDVWIGRASMTVAGRSEDADQFFEVVDPATGLIVARAPECSAAQLDAAFDSAQRAQRAWCQDEAARRQGLRDAAAAITAEARLLSSFITTEQGKPLGDASMEVMATAAWLEYFAELEIPHEVVRNNPRVRIDVSRRALGVVAAMTPWNYPIMLAAWKIGPALLAGNTVVLKPSPLAPLSALKLGELLATVLPPGVVNVVSGGAELGQRMVSHPVPGMVSFTGSVATGREVAVAAAQGLKRVTLELGGNDPAILLDDVDVEGIASDLFWGAFHNNGQVCSAIKRVYVPERLHDEVVEALAQVARSVPVGPGTERSNQLGPVGNRSQFDRIRTFVSEALSGGARLASGGAEATGPGLFHPPAIVVGAPRDSRLVQEEQFGPALPVLPYRTIEEAVEQANDSAFGLSASVWGEDTDRASEVAAQIECGTAWVNTHLVLLPEQPFGGAKNSGLGVENGPWGLDSFARLQVLHRREI